MTGDPIDRLARLSSARSRTKFLRRHPELRTPAVVEDLYARVVRLARIDAQLTDRLAQMIGEPAMARYAARAWV